MKLGVAAGCCVLLANCNSNKLISKLDPRYGTSSSPRVVAFGEPVPKGGGTYRIGKPYVVAGRTYFPEEKPDYRAEGMASWYGDDFHGRLTANGEVFDMQSISAAHPTLPMPSYARVTNLANNRSLIVRINDRGPFKDNRVIDLSVKSAHLLGFHGDGLTRVRVEYVGRAPLEGSDDRKLLATLRHGGEQAPAPSGVMLASAKPFLPAMAAPMRGGPVPVPPDRPFRLGHDGGGEPSDRAGMSEMSARSKARPVPAAQNAAQNTVVAERFGSLPSARLPVASPAASPALAYQPPRYDAPTGLLSGRGLY